MALSSLTLVLVICLVTKAWASAVDLTPAQAPIAADYFGIHIHNPVSRGQDSAATAWPKQDFGAWRLHDSHASWRDIEPRAGKWDFSTIDKYQKLAVEHGCSMLLTLGQTPTWASSRASEGAFYGMGAAAPPANVEDWRDYVGAVAERYRGHIEAYEIWNEPRYSDLESVVHDGRANFYSGDVASMVTLARVAYGEIKRIDPKAIVVSPATDDLDGRRLREFLAQGGGPWVDVIAHHLYTATAPEPEDDILEKLASLRKVMNLGGVANKQLWVTEIGYVTQGPRGTLEGNPPGGMRVYTPREAGARIARTMLLLRAANVSRVYWYAWDDGVFGLTWDSRSPEGNDAGIAMRTVWDWMIRETLRYCRRDDTGLWTCRLERAGQTQRMVYWRANGRQSLPVPPEFRGATAKSLWGESFPAQDTIDVGDAPIMLGR